jgi:hypothetical protein
MGAIAVVIYDCVGLAILRSAWINPDTIWAVALVVASLISIRFHAGADCEISGSPPMGLC